MLIICPECHNKISDQANICVHCGYPIKKMYELENKNICIIDGIPHDLSEQLANINNSQYQPLKKFVIEYGMSLADASNLWRLIKTTNQVPSEYDSSRQNEYRTQLNINQNINQPKCPTCGSTNIEKISTTKKAAGGFMFGLFSKTARSQFACKDCGYKW